MCYRKYGGGEYISGDRADSCKETTTTSCSSGDNEKKKTAKQQCFHPFTTKRWKSYTVCYREALKGQQKHIRIQQFQEWMPKIKSLHRLVLLTTSARALAFSVCFRKA